MSCAMLTVKWAVRAPLPPSAGIPDRHWQHHLWHRRVPYLRRGDEGEAGVSSSGSTHFYPGALKCRSGCQCC
eukprot:364034-Chlamydomonas_euryale.AAC.8